MLFSGNPKIKLVLEAVGIYAYANRKDITSRTTTVLKNMKNNEAFQSCDCFEEAALSLITVPSPASQNMQMMCNGNGIIGPKIHIGSCCVQPLESPKRHLSNSEGEWAGPK